MNIESLIAKINLFNKLIIESGFKRDIQDYIQAIQQGQNQNLVFMKDLSNKVIMKFEEIENYSLEEDLKTVLRDTEPFTELFTKDELIVLDRDTQIPADQYHQKFTSLLKDLLKSIEQNRKELEEVYSVFKRYVSNDKEYESEVDQAIVSLIFKDLKTITSLKEFSKVLSRWNRTLLLYHTLLKSDSPDDISLVEIQNGSIDIIFNVDFDIAIDLTELVRVGLRVYGAYLLYKSSLVRELISSYMGNRKLIKAEEDREKLMLENIRESIENKALDQHKEKLKIDKEIDTTGIDKKIKEVSRVITDHIIKGNEMKLLTAPKPEDDEEKDLSEKLREETAIFRERFKLLNSEDKQYLLEKYSIKEDSLNEDVNIEEVKKK